MMARCFVLVALMGMMLFAAPGDASAQEAATAQRARVAAPDATVTVSISESFLNRFFDSVFTNLRKPSYPIAKRVSASRHNADAAHVKSRSQCASMVVLEREIGGVRTEVRLTQDRILAPLAFSGTYELPLVGCVDFEGWASAVVSLQFDREKQVLRAHIDVQDVHLQGTPQMTNAILTRYVQRSLDQRINPVEVLRADQLAAIVPVKPAGGSLRLHALEVQPQALPGELRLRVNFEFLKVE